ncbi:hypothetical protein [Actinocorallia sp. A-T 12471]|uniref:hypothetical protein n=1 Tax=Actinocorallia sp. A-T 12471 TaxID=3089813 RepID=UPI0029CFADD4|nr:hypothetical protein [Actinocorallia sp. A-T 12471]MDX6740761.1 hypothetical protein [Actinocorallia sp. A-T 12471]
MAVPVKVAMRSAENAMIEDRPDRVLKLAEAIPRDGFRSKSSSVNRHRLDVANAHAHLRQYAEAFDVLQEVRSLAPEWIVNQRLARDVLAKIISRRRTLTAEIERRQSAVLAGLLRGAGLCADVRHDRVGGYLYVVVRRPGSSVGVCLRTEGEGVLLAIGGVYTFVADSLPGCVVDVDWMCTPEGFAALLRRP